MNNQWVYLVEKITFYYANLNIDKFYEKMTKNLTDDFSYCEVQSITKDRNIIELPAYVEKKVILALLSNFKERYEHVAGVIPNLNEEYKMFKTFEIIKKKKIILPIWRSDVSSTDVANYSLDLVDKVAAKEGEGIEKMVEKITNVIKNKSRQKWT